MNLNYSLTIIKLKEKKPKINEIPVFKNLNNKATESAEFESILFSTRMLKIVISSMPAPNGIIDNVPKNFVMQLAPNRNIKSTLYPKSKSKIIIIRGFKKRPKK